MEGLVVEMAFSRVSVARCRGLSVVWLELGGILLRRVEKRLWRRSGWARISEMKVVVWWRISVEEVVAMLAVVVTTNTIGQFGDDMYHEHKDINRNFCFLCWRENYETALGND